MKGGLFRYYPPYSLEEAIAAGPFIDDRVTERQIRDRFYRFGGTVRTIFGSDAEVQSAESEQDAAAKNINVETTSKIVTNSANLDAAKPSSPPDSPVGILSSVLATIK